MRDPQHYVMVGDRRVPLPRGVTTGTWALERNRYQNPRIRGLLGCIHLIDGVLESNYAILHCSPERLAEIWSTVRLVVDRLDEVSKLVREPSCIPRLEAARERADSSLAVVRMTVISELLSFDEHVEGVAVMRLRKCLCVAIGELNAFLRDAFGGIVANDPRSLQDEDYYLSKRFPRDVEEAEWLLRQVKLLEGTCCRVSVHREESLRPFLEEVHGSRRVPDESDWDGLDGLFHEVNSGLVPQLKSAIALRGIRFDELETVDECATRLPSLCSELESTFRLGRRLVEVFEAEVQEAAAAGLHLCERVVAGGLETTALRLYRQLDDLGAFVVLWRQGIERRRALMLTSPPNSEEDDD